MSLKVHFLNVGRGDCTIIQFPTRRVAVVDIHNLKALDDDTKAEMLAFYRESQDYILAQQLGYNMQAREQDFIKAKEASLTDPLEYFDRHIGKHEDIFRFIVTHPDMDHMTGLHRIYYQDTGKTIWNFWYGSESDFNLADATDAEWERSPYDKRDWEAYKDMRRSGDSPKALLRRQHLTGDFWTEDGVEILAPTSELEELAVRRNAANIASMVLKVTHAGKSILLGGDATSDETWQAIHGSVDLSGVAVLKASHHGRKSGYYGPAVKEMSPLLTITSVGEKAHDATQNYRRYSDYTVSLRKAGDITVEIDDSGELTWSYNVWEHAKDRINAAV